MEPKEYIAQKVAVVVEKHILNTKIGYVIEQIKRNKNACKPYEPAVQNTKDSVYIQHTDITNNKDIDTREIQSTNEGVIVNEIKIETE
jgi:hypothetical protein